MPGTVHPGVYAVVQENSAGGFSYQVFDKLERVVRSGKRGFNNGSDNTVEWVVTDQIFDDQGRPIYSSLPYFAGASATNIYWTQTFYDAYGHPNKVVEPASQALPAGKISTISYEGLTTKQTDALGHTSSKTVNVLGQTVSITDAAGSSQTYEYDANGKISKLTDAAGNTIITEYNRLGHKILMDDPNMGIWHYKHNVLGQLTRQTDAKDQITTLEYDLLGRQVLRIEPHEDPSQADLKTVWVYDTEWIGALTSVGNTEGYGRLHTYDEYGRSKSLHFR